MLFCEKPSLFRWFCIFSSTWCVYRVKLPLKLFENRFKVCQSNDPKSIISSEKKQEENQRTFIESIQESQNDLIWLYPKEHHLWIETKDNERNREREIEGTWKQKMSTRTALCKNYGDDTLKGGITRCHLLFTLLLDVDYSCEDDICRCIHEF